MREKYLGACRILTETAMPVSGITATAHFLIGKISIRKCAASSPSAPFTFPKCFISLTTRAHRPGITMRDGLGAQRGADILWRLRRNRGDLLGSAYQAFNKMRLLMQISTRHVSPLGTCFGELYR